VDGRRREIKRDMGKATPWIPNISIDWNHFGYHSENHQSLSWKGRGKGRGEKRRGIGQVVERQTRQLDRQAYWNSMAAEDRHIKGRQIERTNGKC